MGGTADTDGYHLLGQNEIAATYAATTAGHTFFDADGVTYSSTKHFSAGINGVAANWFTGTRIGVGKGAEHPLTDTKLEGSGGTCVYPAGSSLYAAISLETPLGVEQDLTTLTAGAVSIYTQITILP